MPENKEQNNLPAPDKLADDKDQLGWHEEGSPAPAGMKAYAAPDNAVQTVLWEDDEEG